MKKNIRHYSITNYLNSTTKIVCNTAILYILFAKLTKLIFISQINLFPFFPAMGLATAFAIIFGRKAILGVAIGSLLFSLDSFKQELFYATNHQVFINSLTICLVRPLIAVINVFLVSHYTELWCKTKYPFAKGTHILNFSIASLLGSIMASTIGIGFIAIFSSFTSNDLQLFWNNLIRGNALGIILITPFVLSWLYKTEMKTQWSPLKKIEAFILPFITLAASIYVFVTPDHNESVLYLLLVWAAYRFNIRLITILMLIIAVISMYYTGYRLGGFGLGSWNNNFFLLQVFLFVNMVSILFFKAILKEKEAKEYKLKISKQVLSTERNILKATIESTNTTSIFSLDTNLNYLNFNAPHEKFMKNIHGASIKIGYNHLELISYENQKEEFNSIFQSVLNGNSYEKEEKDLEGSYWKISKSPIRDNDENIIGISVIISDISDLKQKEIQLKENNHSLNERIKELSCLYTVTKILNRKSLSTSEKLQACAQIIPASLQFPEKANSRILFDGNEFLSNNYRKNEIQINQKIIINREEFGCIEMGYSETGDLKKETIFLEEEIKLLETISNIISKSLETKIREENLKKSEETYRILFENVQDVFFKTSIKTKEILDVSPSCSTFNGITREELIGQDRSIIYSNKDKMQTMFQKIMTENRVVDYTNEITIKGKLFYVSINAKIIFDSNGEPEFAVGSLRDITKRKLAEENLKISEEKFRSIYENMQDVYYLHTLDGNLLDVSPSIEKHFLEKRENLIGMHLPSFYNELAKYEELKSKILKEGAINDQEIEFLTPSGDTLFFSLNSKLVKDSNGELNLVEGTMRNINERIINQKQILEATEKIKESEAKFRSIFENTQDVYFMHTLDGEIFEISPSVEKHLKYKREEIIGLNTINLHYDLVKQNKLREKIIKDGGLNDEYVQFVTATGEPIFFSVNCKIIRDQDGIPSHVEGSLRNINEKILSQKQLLEASEKIKESEAKFRSIYENSQDVYFQTTIDGKILNCSPSFEKHFKIPLDQVLEKTVVNLYYEPKDREVLLIELKKGVPVTDFDIRFKDSEGNIIFFSLNARMVFNENDDPIYIEGSMRNINDRITTQKEILSKNRKLEFQNVELEQFAYIASHDLQEPLITVIHCIQLLEEELDKNLNEDQRQYLQFINNSTSRMQLLVKGLLDYSRIGKDRKNSTINCNEIVSDVLADMKVSLQESNAVIEYPNLPTIEGNTTEMRQLFQNLISNANKYRKKGQQPKIKIAAEKDGNNWLFSIQDNGIGIEEHDMDKVFVIFKRLHNRDEYHGTGIGLSHCKKIIEQHGGKIWVESKYNEGSTFKWTLPVEPNL